MKEKYDFIKVEKTAQTYWNEIDAYRVTEKDNSKKFYCVSMLPYPSGKLHMGHVRNYTINDVMCRYMRMKGYNVLMPMGWDAFGMPAENAAIANGVSPARWTYDNIVCMKKQMKAMGLAIDWSREIMTCEPDYYYWNQWMFLKMLQKGLVYKKTGIVNWDPVDKTVLANEQVIDGRGWRSGSIVEKRKIPMYYFRITNYAEQLEADLHNLRWPERIKSMQKNWIGKSSGVDIAFPYTIDNEEHQIQVFTTRVDAIMGVTFIAIATEHPLAIRLAKNQPELAMFINSCANRSLLEEDFATEERKGVDTKFVVRNPLTGKPIPIWIGNYVLMSYGNGATMGIPAHNKDDFAFALRHKLPIRQVIKVIDKNFSDKVWNDWYSEKIRGILINSGKYNGLDCIASADAITYDLETMNLCKKRTVYRLRDWGISRQRYWGTPIPIIHCDNCGDVPVPEHELPVILPNDLIPKGTGNPLEELSSFVSTICPKCNNSARRETDTMDTFVDSSWYFLRYTCFDSERIVDCRTDYWMPMDQYIGGVEHAILHLLYSRFWTKVMYDLGLISFKEPAQKLLTQGMVLNETFYREGFNGKKEWFNPLDVHIQEYNKHGRPVRAISKVDGAPLKVGGIQKMSKSKSNGIDPQNLLDRYGADTVRLFIMFSASPEQPLEWSASGIEGTYRFLCRLWSFGQKCIATSKKSSDFTSGMLGKLLLNDVEKELSLDFYKILEQANFDYQRTQYNTVVSAAMKMLSTIEDISKLPISTSKVAMIWEFFSFLLRVLYPISPHITHVLWEKIGYATELGDLINAPWPVVDEKAKKASMQKLVLQINGKVRGTMLVKNQASSQEIERLVFKNEIVKRFSGGKIPRKVILIPGRVVSVIF